MRIRNVPTVGEISDSSETLFTEANAVRNSAMRNISLVSEDF